MGLVVFLKEIRLYPYTCGEYGCLTKQAICSFDNCVDINGRTNISVSSGMSIFRDIINISKDLNIPPMSVKCVLAQFRCSN